MSMTSIDLPDEVKQECKKNGFTYKELIVFALKTKKKEAETDKNYIELTKDNENLRKKFNKMAVELFGLKEKIGAKNAETEEKKVI